MSKHFQRLAPALLAFLLACQTGCGLLTQRQDEFANAEPGENGETFLLDDLRDIANDEDLDREEKRQAFRDLGIEDEDLIDALLNLGPNV